MRKWRVWLGAGALVIGLAQAAQAQRFGPQISYADDFDLGVGVRGVFDLTNTFTTQGPFSRTFLITSFDWFFPDCDECTYWEINGNVAVPFQGQKVTPYLGAGLNIAHVSVDVGGGFGSASDTEAGLNFLGGLQFPFAAQTGYVEARIEASGGEQLVLTFGVLFGRGR